MEPAASQEGRRQGTAGAKRIGRDQSGCKRHGNPLGRNRGTWTGDGSGVAFRKSAALGHAARGTSSARSRSTRSRIASTEYSCHLADFLTGGRSFQLTNPARRKSNATRPKPTYVPTLADKRTPPAVDESPCHLRRVGDYSDTPTRPSVGGRTGRFTTTWLPHPHGLSPQPTRAHYRHADA